MKLYVFIIITVFVSVVANAQSDEASRKRNFNTENYVAMREWDPVSYFQGKPAKGVTQYQSKYKEIIYYFASAENKTAFEKTPAKYEPAYGGFCAYTVGLNGDRVKINPLTYKIVNNKLYLFYNFGNDNRLLKWNQDEKKMKAAADKNWYAKMH